MTSVNDSTLFWPSNTSTMLLLLHINRSSVWRLSSTLSNCDTALLTSFCDSLKINFSMELKATFLKPKPTNSSGIKAVKITKMISFDRIPKLFIIEVT